MQAEGARGEWVRDAAMQEVQGHFPQRGQIAVLCHVPPYCREGIRNDGAQLPAVSAGVLHQEWQLLLCIVPRKSQDHVRS